jgi:hypothetical protein
MNLQILMRLLILIPFILICTSPLAFGSTAPSVPDSTLIWRTPLYMAINQYLSVAIHESGHAAAEIMSGNKIKGMSVGLLYGEIQTYGSASDETVFTDLAGPFANRLAAAAFNAYLDNNEYSMDEGWRSFLGTAYIWNRGNFAWLLIVPPMKYILFGKPYGTDWSNAATTMCNGDERKLDIIMGAFIALELLDLYVTRFEIEKNFNRMMGKYPSGGTVGTSSLPAIPIPLGIMPYGNGLIAMKQFVF